MRKILNELGGIKKYHKSIFSQIAVKRVFQDSGHRFLARKPKAHAGKASFATPRKFCGVFAFVAADPAHTSQNTKSARGLVGKMNA